MTHEFRFCPNCATPLAWVADGRRRRKSAAALPGLRFHPLEQPDAGAGRRVIEYHGQVLLARNAAWPGKMYALITGFMEAGETPQGGH